MDNFFKSFLASLLAIMVSFGVLTVITFAFFAVMIGSLVKMDNTVVSVSPNSVLKIDFSTPIVESLSDNPVEYLDVMTMQYKPFTTSYDVIKSIRVATLDPNIKSIYLDMSGGLMVDLANMEEIRQTLAEFKDSGKKIYSYADVYTQKSYYLSSVADSIFLCPVGDLQWTGISSNSIYFKGALDKLGVNVEVFKYGKYKSAVEPFLLSQMSGESRQQSQMMVDNVWERITGTVAASRNIEVADLKRYAAELSVTGAEDALKLGFVDRLAYKNELTIDGRVILMSNYIENNRAQALISGAGSTKNQIEIIYADGNIVSGKSQNGIIGDVTLVRKLNAAAEDEDVKAIVLRVNSPGGSALASDVIDNALRSARAKKPVVVSMGAYAASGGYYIASNADAIVASPFTLTGSIGVFGIMFNAGETITKNFGVTFDGVKTSPHADMGSVYRPMTSAEKVYLQKGVNKVYENFVTAVCDGRNMTFEQVDSMAQGRVWMADDALRLGLVDKIGGLLEAVDLAADKADVRDNYVIKNSIVKNDLLNALFASMSMESVSILARKVSASKVPILDDMSVEMRKLELLLDGDKIQAITPFYLNL